MAELSMHKEAAPERSSTQLRGRAAAQASATGTRGRASGPTEAAPSHYRSVLLRLINDSSALFEPSTWRTGFWGSSLYQAL